ncbi:CRP/FNR family transcriptional regulator [Rivularia sp. IAM M-261]|nr:CRP/FNR family transcriptional regulator [Calothrix sp. PCC 7716]GJD19658.1 CRP/FNR family transcriptional regulator [Rivularia sp. IAM M-261]
MNKTSNDAQKPSNLENSSNNEKLLLRIFDRRDIIPERNDVLWKIESGVVRSATWSEDGTFITLGYWGVGDVVGFALSKITPYQLDCLTPTEVTIIPPQFWYKHINLLFSHIQQTEELLSIINYKGVHIRMCQFLIWLSDKFGRDVEKGKLIDIHLTHQDIAEVLNTTRVTITRLLMQLEAEGKLTRHKRQIIVTQSLLGLRDA